MPRSRGAAGGVSRRTKRRAWRASIAGYWAVTPEGSWIVGRQNDDWKGPDGIGARWNAPWSAAFISWVMCEAGLGKAAQFQRAIAHHAYIDQAIRARDGRAAQAAFAAYDMGETAINPGDLLCSSRRPVYRTLAERRRQPGVGARTHCDIVVKVDETRERILAIGGNVRATVSLKLLRAQRQTWPAVARGRSGRRRAADLRAPEAARRTDRGRCAGYERHAEIRRMRCRVPEHPGCGCGRISPPVASPRRAADNGRARPVPGACLSENRMPWMLGTKVAGDLRGGRPFAWHLAAQGTDAALVARARAIHERVLTLDTHNDIEPPISPPRATTRGA